MRAVKAKQLRKLVGYNKGDTDYQEQRYVKKITTAELNEDGTRKEVFVTRITRVLSSGCSRAGYQYLKRNG